MTDDFEKKVAVDGPVVNAGELGSSTFSPGQALPAGPLGLGQRWTVARKREVVLRLLRDEPVQLLSRQLGVEIFRLEQWRPYSMGLAGLYGSTAAGAARGLALRMDHGSQYLSDHFTNQIKFWGIQPSYAFVAEPQTNGVAERFNRTLKEQIIHGRIYRNIAELRDAVRDFVELYNAQWIVEKNGYLSPAQARQAWHAAISIRPAA